MDNIKERLQLVPKKPGCYQMKDINGQIIYVGKAKVLANRLKSYFTGSHDAKTTRLVSEIASFEYIITSSELEAFLLELNFIKEHRPKYNIMLMDDKTYPYICITNEKHPRIMAVRDKQNFRRQKIGKLFGPFPNVKACHQTVELLNKLFPFRKCQVIPKKQCLYYSMGQCLAPCVNQLPSNAYDEIKGKVIRYLNGDNKELITLLTEKMEQASENLEFEKAIEYRESINDLNILNDEQKMTLNDGVTRDIVGYYVKDDVISIQLFHMRRGQITMRTGEVFEINDNIEDILVSYIAQFYEKHQKAIPQELLVPETNIVDLLKEYLKIRVIVPQKGLKKKLLDLVRENAQENLEVLYKERLQMINKTTKTLEELAEILGIGYPKYIELYDNSNIQGTSSVSGMVSYIDGKPSKRHYRKYKIKTVVGADDYHTMQEVVRRRLKNNSDTKLNRPNVIIADGGKLQVKAIKEVLKELRIGYIYVMGLVKDDKHKTSAIVTSDLVEVSIDKHSNLFLLLEAMQEEVHRFAISFFRHVQTKSLFSSSLDCIEGIGPKRKKMLLEQFENLSGIKKAPEEDLKALGIPQKVIDALKKG